MSSISYESLSRSFQKGEEEFLAVDDISLEISDKEFVAVVGPSGCGKTTLLRMAAGLDFPTSGKVAVGGEPVRSPGPDRAVVFQQFALFPWKTVRENIGFGMKCQRADKSEREEAVHRYIELMGLQGHEETYPHQLSGGMQQRVAIARSYVLDPEVLLMDEPFGALDAQTRVLMQEELIRLARLNPRTVLFITHNVDEAVYLADRVIVMTKRPGRIKEILEVGSVRRKESWEDRHMEEVTDSEAFGQLRTRIWKLLREQLEEQETEGEQSHA